MRRKQQFYIYILASRPGGALYVGVTNDLVRRVWEHKNGFADSHTKRYRIVLLVYFEIYPSIADAIQREKNMKHWPHGTAFACNHSNLKLKNGYRSGLSLAGGLRQSR